MDPLSITASIVSLIQFSQLLAQYASGVKGYSKEQKRLKTEVDTTQALLKQLEKHPQLGNEAQSLSGRSQFANAIQKGPLKDLDQLIKTLRTELDHKAHGPGRLLWPFRAKDVDAACKTIQAIKNSILLALAFESSQTLSELQDQSETAHDELRQLEDCIRELQDDNNEMRSRLSDLQEGQSNIGTDVEFLVLERQQSRLDDFCSWIHPEDFEKIHRYHTDLSLPGSRRWLLESTEFNDWLFKDIEDIYCPGIPGAGKTFTTAIVIEYVRRCLRADERSLISYYYFDYKRNPEESLLNLLCAITRQLISATKKIPTEFHTLYRKYKSKNIRPTLNEIKQLLSDIFCATERVYIILDALDECPKHIRDSLLKEVKIYQAKRNIHLFATSRFDLDIEKCFEDAAKIEVRATDDDLRNFLEERITRLAPCISQRADLQDEVCQKVLEVSDGMFLLAGLHLDSLRDKTTVSKIRKALRGLPHGRDALQGAYGAALERIDTQAPGLQCLANRTLSWVVLARTTLKMEALQHALAVNLETRSLDLNDIEDESLLISVCAGLVILDSSTRELRLSHYTVQEFFIEHANYWLGYGHGDLAFTVITYLSLDDVVHAIDRLFDMFKSRGTSPPLNQYLAVMRKYPLLLYAAQNWFEQLSRSNSRDWRASSSQSHTAQTKVLESFTEDFGFEFGLKFSHFALAIEMATSG